MNMTDVLARAGDKSKPLKLVDVSKRAKEKEPGAEAALLALERINIPHGKTAAVNNLSMVVCAGVIAALAGPAGAGKTSILNCISGQIKPAGGRIVFKGKMIADFSTRNKKAAGFSPGRAKRLGIAYAGRDVIANVGHDAIANIGHDAIYKDAIYKKEDTVYSYLFGACGATGGVTGPRSAGGPLSGILPLNIVNKRSRHDRAMALLDEYGFVYLKDEAMSRVPPGQLKRLEIVRALAAAPSLLLLDEPASGLSLEEAWELYDFIRLVRRRNKLTVLMATENFETALGVSDHVYVLDGGNLVAYGAPEHVMDDPLATGAYKDKG